ncbi:MAG: ABC transporter ATP-binding protein [Chloroflexota bacterium]
MIRHRYRQLLAHYLAPLRWHVGLLTVLLLGSIGLQLTGPQILRSFIDATQSGAAHGTLTLAAALYLGVETAWRATALGASYVGASIGGIATNTLRADLLRHCLLLDMPFHKRHAPGELVERLSGDVGALDNFLSQFAIRLLGSALLVLGVLVILFREDWRVGTGLAIYAALTFVALRGIHPLAVRRKTVALEARAAQMAFMEERLGGTEDIRANGAEAHVLGRAQELACVLLRRQRAAQLLSEMTAVASHFLFALGTAAGLGVGAVLYARGEATVGTVFLIVTYSGMLFAPLEEVREQAQDLQNASAGIERIDALLGQQPRVQDPPLASRGLLPDGPLALAFQRVSFQYDDRPVDLGGDGAPDDGAAVLHDISFSLAPGKVLGLLGRTGSGKTTLTRLIFRLYDPTQGTIRLGGADLRDVALTDLRRRVAMVTQDVQLFHGTVRDNVTLFDPSVPVERIVAALDQAGLAAWVRSLPLRLNTLLGPGGRGLSAGEAQLLAFARVFLKNPAVVILDEASARLDPATERRLARATDRLLAGRTGIVVAHRLRTVRRVDDILILQEGRIREYGRREALAQDPTSRYVELLRSGLEEVLEHGTASATKPADGPAVAAAATGVRT